MQCQRLLVKIPALALTTAAQHFQPLPENGFYREGLAGLKIDPHHGHFGGGGATAAIEDALTQFQGTVAEFKHQRTSFNIARRMDLAQKLNRKGGNHPGPAILAIMRANGAKKRNTAFLAELKKFDIVQMAVAVHIGKAQNILTHMQEIFWNRQVDIILFFVFLYHASPILRKPAKDILPPGDIITFHPQTYYCYYSHGFYARIKLYEIRYPG